MRRVAVLGLEPPLEGEGKSREVSGGGRRPKGDLVTPPLSSSRSKTLPASATRCPGRPRACAAARRPPSTAWSSPRSPSGWSCAGSWTAGCCECLAPPRSTPLPTPTPRDSVFPPPRVLRGPPTSNLGGVPARGDFPPRDIWQWPGTFWLYHRGEVLLASNGQSPGMLLNPL